MFPRLCSTMPHQQNEHWMSWKWQSEPRMKTLPKSPLAISSQKYRLWLDPWKMHPSQHLPLTFLILPGQLENIFYFFEQNIFQVFFTVVLKNCGKFNFPKKKRTQATLPGRLCSSITAEPCSKFCPKSFKLYRMLAALGWAWTYGSTTAGKFLS